ncbi:RHS repeat domain-containing protein [Cupriavidus sp. SW-Y-13]|uniref:RHS repeat domain-containing protein n=1 Tax=Cupriavidus sp. SW-Y-13 TaxID=2653854 RepID=UPI00351A5CD4
MYEGDYDIDEDPLWTYTIPPQPFDAMAWYQCDHLGTPQELTDETGEIAWSAQYKAWGAAQGVISDAARKAGIQNPLRFQGQYLDHETGLHYNRYRYYDPVSGRFISKDPIGFAGGLNVFLYGPNPVGWVDPLGLARCPCDPCSAYEVGPFNRLKRRSASGDDLDIHHAMQKQPAAQVVVGYDQQTAPSIAVPADEHAQIPTLKGSYAGTARNLLAKDITDLRRNTNASNECLQKLIVLNKTTYPNAFKK